MLNKHQVVLSPDSKSTEFCIKVEVEHSIDWFTVLLIAGLVAGVLS